MPVDVSERVSTYLKPDALKQQQEAALEAAAQKKRVDTGEKLNELSERDGKAAAFTVADLIQNKTEFKSRGFTDTESDQINAHLLDQNWIFDRTGTPSARLEQSLQDAIDIQPFAAGLSVADKTDLREAMLNDSEFKALYAVQRAKVLSNEHFTTTKDGITDAEWQAYVPNQADYLLANGWTDPATGTADKTACEAWIRNNPSEINNIKGYLAKGKIQKQVENMPRDMAREYYKRTLDRVDEGFRTTEAQSKDKIAADALQKLRQRWDTNNRDSISEDMRSAANGDYNQFLLRIGYTDPAERARMIKNPQLMAELKVKTMEKMMRTGGKISNRDFEKICDERGIEAATQMLDQSTNFKAAVKRAREAGVLDRRFGTTEDLLRWAWKYRKGAGIAALFFMMWLGPVAAIPMAKGLTYNYR